MFNIKETFKEDGLALTGLIKEYLKSVIKND